MRLKNKFVGKGYSEHIQTNALANFLLSYPQSEDLFAESNMHGDFDPDLAGQPLMVVEVQFTLAGKFGEIHCSFKCLF